ncbi:sulfite exporter TauE/SafE family protein [Candidatus Dojkabacteria bacterium]|nr:sulfite exporter TauE/SafE family protein [Candidatus Dojkabacteria bacterium]
MPPELGINIDTVLIIAIVTIIAYILKALIGFGTAIIIMPILMYFFGPRDALVIGAFADLFSNVFLLKKEWTKIKEHPYLYLLPGLIIGTFIGVSILIRENDLFLKRLMGIAIILYIATQFLNIRIKIKKQEYKIIYGLFAGLIAGISGGLFNINGPPLVIYLNSVLDDKVEIRENLVILLIIDSLWRIFLLTINHQVSELSVSIFVPILIPSILIGFAIGSKIDQNLKTKAFKIISHIVLLVIGIEMLI